ncbi:hypothetical protein E4U11_004409 [Claviceps purpurea]|nr:hypothetical protein E4U11_004409 [Claviceps purpurea]
MADGREILGRDKADGNEDDDDYDDEDDEDDDRLLSASCLAACLNLIFCFVPLPCPSAGLSRFKVQAMRHKTKQWTPYPSVNSIGTPSDAVSPGFQRNPCVHQRHVIGWNPAPQLSRVEISGPAPRFRARYQVPSRAEPLPPLSRTEATEQQSKAQPRTMIRTV